MHNNSWRNNEWSKINSLDDIVNIFKSIEEGIAYVDNLCNKGKAFIEDTEYILDDFERLNLGIRKLEVCKIANKEQIQRFIKLKEEYNDKLKWLNTRIMCCRD
ncbi:MAG: hypothetical protein E6176_13365 [Clostridium celatum]|nr:hypothetical protein [Clostridium celatum]